MSWRAVGRDYRAVLVIMRGDLDRGLRLLRANGDEHRTAIVLDLRQGR
jgi:hypothetical protein